MSRIELPYFPDYKLPISPHALNYAADSEPLIFCEFFFNR